MDSRIENLKSTTFCGTRLTRRQIADLQKTVKMFPALSRHELAATLCTHLGWFTPKGRDRRLGSCLRMLEQLESGGIVSQLCQESSAISGGSGDPPIWAGLRSARNFRAFHAASCHVSDSGSDARTTPIRPYR